MIEHHVTRIWFHVFHLRARSLDESGFQPHPQKERLLLDTMEWFFQYAGKIKSSCSSVCLLITPEASRQALVSSWFWVCKPCLLGDSNTLLFYMISLSHCIENWDEAKNYRCFVSQRKIELIMLRGRYKHALNSLLFRLLSFNASLKWHIFTEDFLCHLCSPPNTPHRPTASRPAAQFSVCLYRV